MEKIEKKNIANILAITPLQEGLLFHFLKEPQSDFYREQLCLFLSGSIERSYFEKAWHMVRESNEMLRTTFRWEGLENPVQVILNTDDW
ncbi:MAG: condensation domain-containing protein, partial [Acidobacteria bacterium]|nr:condensation domain-containing protein [Acidobacteriota bacterium]